MADISDGSRILKLNHSPSTPQVELPGANPGERLEYDPPSKKSSRASLLSKASEIEAVEAAALRRKQRTQRTEDVERDTVKNYMQVRSKSNVFHVVDEKESLDRIDQKPYDVRDYYKKNA